MQTFKHGHIVKSTVSGTSYRIEKVLGEGGFGRAYLAEELNRRNKVVEQVCLKTTLDQASWHRESYFGELLKRSKRAIQTLDSFPIPPKSNRSPIMFCLVLELAEHGTLQDYLDKMGNKPWTEARARREIIALLKMLDQLHGAAATHRDITPMNIFVCGRGTLKLGDFGIARHELAGNPKTIDAFNPAFVTRGFVEATHRHWEAVDDVFQMGQLLGMLLSGNADDTLTIKDINQLGCGDELKAIIKRCIGPRSKRYGDAFEMMQALAGDEVTASKEALESLDGKTVVFTGPLSIARFDAEVLVLQEGGKVAKQVSKNVDVIVQGGRSPHYKSGHKGRKLSTVEKLNKQGAKIVVIGEGEFRKLTKPK
jgi:serine/threonine protein kinase